MSKRLFHKDIQKLSDLYYETSGWLVFVCFLEEIEDTKKTFQNYLAFTMLQLLIATLNYNIKCTHQSICNIALWWSTCPLVLASWLLNHVIYHILRKKELFARLRKFIKWLFLLKMILKVGQIQNDFFKKLTNKFNFTTGWLVFVHFYGVVFLLRKNVNLWIFSGLQTVLFFLSLR